MTSTARVTFEGELRPEIVAALQRYMFLSGLKSLLFKLAIVAVILLFTASRGESWRIGGELATGVVLLTIMLVATLHAWRRNRAWWRSVQSAFPTGVHGSADPQQIVVTGFLRPVLWSEITTHLHHGPLLLLFIAPKIAFPFHRSFFASDHDWRQFITWAENDGTKSAA